MVEGEGQTAQPQSRAAGQIPAQQQKPNPEELFIRVHKGDVKGATQRGNFPAPVLRSEGGGEAGEIEDARGGSRQE